MDNILSTTIRCVGEKNNLNNFLKGIDLISKSKFNNANFNFCEIQELLDDDNFEIEFKTLLKEFNKLNYTVAHAPIHWPFLFNEYYNLDYQKLENRINKSIKLASLLNIKNIVMHIGTKLNSDGTYNLKESVKENIKYLEPFVFLAENAPQFNDTAPYIDELIEITDYYNNLYKKEVVGICFDFGHANVGKLNIYDRNKKKKNRQKGEKFNSKKSKG